MKRITSSIPRWHIYLHRRMRKLPRVGVRDDAGMCFEDELFERLYAGEAKPTSIKRFKYSAELPRIEEKHKQAGAHLVEEVMSQCHRNPYMAALATQWIATLLEDVTEETKDEETAEQGEQKDAAHGLEGVALDDSQASPSKTYDPTDQKQVEIVADLIKDDERLKKIALLAGKLKRIMLTKQKEKVKHDPDELSDIEQGGDLARLLPSELMKFLSPKLQLAVKADLLEKKCLQYAVKTLDFKQRGPFVLCMDKSGSMAGDKDIWATAIGLAILDMAHRQKRVFILIGFDEEVFQAVPVFPGKAIPKWHLCVAPRGGTDIGNALGKALRAIQTRTAMQRADIILITDGESGTDQAEGLRALAKKSDVEILGIGIGIDPDAIRPWCDEAHVVTDMGGIDDKTATALFSK